MENFAWYLYLLISKIIVPDGCWRYDPFENSWSALPGSISSFYYEHGIAHDNKLYIFGDDSSQEVFDTSTNLWVSWPTPPKTARPGVCLVSWKDSIILFNNHFVQMYNSTTNVWTLLQDGSFVPFTLFLSSCVTLPNDKILVAGLNSIATYDVDSNSWQSVRSRQTLGALVKLNDRVFLIDEESEEYHYQTNSWSPVEEKLLFQRQFFSAINVPANLFSNDGFSIRGCEGIA